MLAHPLADYASPTMQTIWSPVMQINMERIWWNRILNWLVENTDVYDHISDRDLKLRAYAEAIYTIDLDDIEAREQVTKHDVKARIESYNAEATALYRSWVPIPDWRDAPHPPLELIHWGMTSADVVDNVSLIKMRQSLSWLMAYAPDDIHGAGFWHLDNAIHLLPLRGLKGPVGTQQDMLDLIKDPRLVNELDEYLASTYGFDSVLNSVGQVYPRSIDYQTAQYVAGAVGGTQPWRTIINGYLSMIAEYSGDQWNEGDVTTSVIRRVALPGLFLAADAALRRATL
jgi:adenylosuccinate lyase